MELNEYYELSRLLGITRDAIRMVRQKELNQYNIDSSRSTVLLMIRHLGIKATATEIAKNLLRKRNTVSQLIIKMAREGLVIKIYDFNKKNLYRVILTQKGIEKLNQSLKRKSFKNIFDVLSTAERDNFESILSKLRDRAILNTKTVSTVPYIPTQDKIFRLYGLMLTIVDITQAARQKELAVHGLHTSHHAILITIQLLGENATPSAIAKRLLRNRSTLCELLAKLAKNNLIEMNPDTEKKNRIKVTLSKKGYEQYLNALNGKILENIFSVLTQEERNKLHSYLNSLRSKASEKLKDAM